MKAYAKTKHRVQFDFAPEALNRLDRLMQMTESTTRADVVRNALRVYEWLVTKAIEGKEMTLTSQRGKEGPIDLCLITGAREQRNTAPSRPSLRKPVSQP